MTYTTYMWKLFTLLFAISFHILCLNLHLNPMCSSALLSCSVQTLSFWSLWSHNLAHIGALLFQWDVKYKTNAFLSSKDRKLDILWSATEIPNRFRIEGKIWSSFPFVPPLVPHQSACFWSWAGEKYSCCETDTEVLAESRHRRTWTNP